MSVLPASLLGVLAVGTALSYLAIAWHVEGDRHDQPGAQAFGGLAVLMSLLPVVVLGSQPAGLAQWDLIPDAMFHVYAPLWAWFVVTYTGEEDRVSRNKLAPLLVPPAVGFVAITLLIVVGVDASETNLGGAIHLVTAMYAFALVFGGAFLLVRAGYSYASTSRRRTVALAIGALTPVLVPTTALTALPGPEPVPDPFVLGYALSVVPFALAVFGYDLFESVPVAEAIGRDTVVTEMDDGVIVVDADERVVDANRAAEETFEGATDSVVGSSFSQLLDGRGLADVEDGEVIAIRKDGPARHYEVRISTLTGGGEDPLGHAVFFHDVTERETRRQRLDVLNRVLRHNLRNDMQVVTSHARVLANEEVEDPTPHAETIERRSDDLVNLGRRAREIERLMNGDPVASDYALAPIVEDVITDVSETFPDATFENEVAPDLTASVDYAHLEVVLENLLDNAARHGDGAPTVTVRSRVTEDPDHPVELLVEDDGPGIPESELSVIRNREETPLEHGSGLGLWTVSWGIDRIGGTVEFDAEDGTTARIGLPGPSGEDATAQSAIG